SETTYANLADLPQVANGDVAGDIHDIVTRTTRRLVAEAGPVTIPLSGGYDSRYLLALWVESGAPIHRLINVSFNRNEGFVAQQVANALGAPLNVIPVPGSIWDIYDVFYHFMADGFPVSKFVTYCIAQSAPDVPAVNGFLGDNLVRGSNHKCNGKYE